MTVDMATTSTRPDPEHAAALDTRASQADKIRYACEQVPVPTTAAVREWLAAYGIRPARSHLSAVVGAWRRDRELPDTGSLPKLTAELLAELDALADVTDTPDLRADHVREPAHDSSDASPVDDASPVATARITTPRLGAHPDTMHDIARTTSEQDSGVPEQSETLSQSSGPVPDRSRTADLRQDLVHEPHRHPGRPRGWIVAWVSFVIGGLVSVAANVAHTLYPTPSQLTAWTAAGRPADTWTPSPGAMAFAAFWPIALILSVEVLTRVSWRPGFLFGLARYGGTIIVAAVAAVMSYRHMSGLLTIWGEDALGAHLGPLAVDGLMVIAAAALLSMSRAKNTATGT